MKGVLTQEVRRLPLPTRRLHVSGRKRNMIKNTSGDAMDKNQKMDGQVHFTRSKPLIIGATLRGVLRLYAPVSSGSSSRSLVRFESIQ